MKIKIIKNISLESTRESLISRFAYLIFFFIMILIYVAILTGIMAVNDEKKILSDFFIAITQISLLVFGIFSSAFGISQDVETKRIYLILSRPVKNYEYIIGKILGVYLACFIILLFINIACMAVFLLKGYFFDLDYLYHIIDVYLKIICISSISLFFASITTSAFTAVGVSVMVWFVAHFINEIKFAFNKITDITYIMKYVLYLFPDFSSSYGIYGNAVIVFYTLIMVLVSSYFFRKLEI